MAQPILLQDRFERMIQDASPDQLPGDAAWEIVDCVPTMGLRKTSSGTSQGGGLMKRGGWTYASEDVSTDATSAQTISAMGYLSASNRLCLMTNNNKFGWVTPGGGAGSDFTLVSTAGLQSAQGYVDAFGKLIITNNDGTTALKYYDGTTFGALAGSPPTAKYAAVWNGRLVLAHSSANKRRLWFSALGDPTTWDTTNSWVDVNRDVSGLAVLPNAMLVFSDNQTARIRGRVPPPGSPDMALDDSIFQIGCPFANSIAVNGPNCVFANEEGVFLTNASSMPQDLTAMCGVKAPWQRYVARSQVSAGGEFPIIYGGFIGNYYLATLATTTPTYPSFLFNLATQGCTLLSNYKPVRSVCMTPQVGDELYFGWNTFVITTSRIFAPESTTKNDADGTAVAPSITTRYYLDAKSYKKRWRYVYIDYMMRDAATDNPTLAVTFYPNWEDTTGSVSLGTLAETTAAQGTIRAKLPIRAAARGGQFKIVQTNASSMTSIGAISADVYAREGGRV